MSDNYIIEVQSEAAGVIVRDGRRYRFFAAGHRFNALEGSLYRNPNEAERAAVQHFRQSERPAVRSNGARAK